MKASLLALLLAAACGELLQASPLTTDELASFLGVSAWKADVKLPPGSFKVQIVEIKDGKASDSILTIESLRTDKTPVPLTVVAGPHEGKYRFTAGTPRSGTYGVTSHCSQLSHTVNPGLPSGALGEGDYVLFGEPIEKNPMRAPQDAANYAAGFILRIEKM